MTDPTPGATATITSTVGDDDTAVALGSGDVPVLATPRLVAWLEAAAVAAVAPALDAGTTTVGFRIDVSHTAPSRPGTEIKATARLTNVDGRCLSFTLAAHQATGPIASGYHERIVVDRQRFLEG